MPRRRVTGGRQRFPAAEAYPIEDTVRCCRVSSDFISRPSSCEKHRHLTQLYPDSFAPPAFLTPNARAYLPVLRPTRAIASR